MSLPNYTAPKNGNSGYISARSHALASLGNQLPDVGTADLALKHGGLAGWDIRKVPMMAQVGGLQVAVPDSIKYDSALVRNSPHVDGQVDVLGVVAGSYPIVQNEDLADLLDTLAEEAGAKYVIAGEMDGGRRAFVTLQLPGTAKVGADRVANYITAIAGHDGDSSTSVLVTPVAIANQTMLNLAYGGAAHKFNVRHTVGAHKLLQQQAKGALEFTFSYLDAFQEVADKLAATTLTQARFEQLIQQAYGAKAGAPGPTVTRAQNKLDKMAELFSDVYARKGVGGTAWAGLTALAEWYDHHSPVRYVGTTGTELELRSRNALADPKAFKNQALKLMIGA